MLIATSLSRMQARFRRRRMAEFVRRMEITQRTFVLDVGGEAHIWDASPVRPRVVFLNHPRARPQIGASDLVVYADGCYLPFRDGAFNLVFSNSVIEHVGDTKSQERFAREAARVGERYWVQTPNRRFPVEQHLWTPLVHWLPRRWQAWLVPRFTVWARLTRAGDESREFYLSHYLDSVRLLAEPELRALFPGATVWRERFLGWTKSLIAYR
jgi:SAM-dependent methyltransferase